MSKHVVTAYVELPPDFVSNVCKELGLMPSDCALVEEHLYRAFGMGLEIGLSRFGKACDRHKDIAGWIGPDKEWSSCFACYLERIAGRNVETH